GHPKARFTGLNARRRGPKPAVLVRRAPTRSVRRAQAASGRPPALEAGPDDGSAAGPAADVEGAAEQVEPPAHTGQAERAGGNGVRIETASVVLDLDHGSLPAVPDTDAHPAGLRVPGDVRERLVQNGSDREGLGVAVERQVRGDVDVDGGDAPSREALDLVCDDLVQRIDLLIAVLEAGDQGAQVSLGLRQVRENRVELA